MLPATSLHGGGADETGEIQVLLNHVPEPIRRHIDRRLFDGLTEIVVDLDRQVQLRFHEDYLLLPRRATQADLEFIVQRVGAFRSDNRAGIEGTLHRISAIRNRYQDLVGVTMRLGRHLAGVGDPLLPTLARGENLLILGPPGSGKTTLLRDLTRIASTNLRRRVIVVDTSNEIGGDGNVPHPAIGTARRIQVPDRADQYRLLLEAVQNHTPEVVVIDEIGTKEEAESAASIAERGVQLIATTHGHTLLNLIKNTQLGLLVGGVHPLRPGAEPISASGSAGAGSARGTNAADGIGDPTFTMVVELVPDAERTMRLYAPAEAVNDLLEGTHPAPLYLLSPRITVEALRATFADAAVFDVRRFRKQVDWYANLLDDPTTPDATMPAAQDDRHALPPTAGPDVGNALPPWENQLASLFRDDGGCKSMHETNVPSAVFDPRTALRFFLALFRDTPQDAVIALQHGEIARLLSQRAPLPLHVLAAAAQAGERITFSPTLREARDPQTICATPIVWVHVRTDLPAAGVLGQLHALCPAAVVRADDGVDIYWRMAGLAREDAPAAMERLAASVGGAATSVQAFRPVPLCADDAALDPDAPAIPYDVFPAAIMSLPRLTAHATVGAPAAAGIAQSVASGQTTNPDDAAGLDVGGATAPSEGDFACTSSTGAIALSDKETGPQSFPEATGLVHTLAGAERLPLEQAWLLWALRESQRRFGQRFTLQQLNVDSVLLVNGHLAVRRGHRYFVVRRAAEGTFDLEPIAWDEGK